MGVDPRLEPLLSQWHELMARGEEAGAATLCRDCPDLLPELQRQIELLQRFGDMAPAEARPADAPVGRSPPTVAGGVPTLPGVPPPERPPPPPIPGYQILSELGRGGMGIVYLARQLSLGRLVALKMIATDGSSGPQAVERFRIEAETVARLQHPGVVQIFEVNQWQPGEGLPGVPFFCMEYCPGGSLDRRLKGTPLPADEAAWLVERLAGAIQAAHDAHIVHRDIKPANVLLVPDGRSSLLPPVKTAPVLDGLAPKISDFSIARRLDEVSQTRTNVVIGTPSYMAPEQARGSKHAGPPADIYALGAILYECLTGRPPFLAASSVETLQQVVNDEPVAPRSLNRTVPRDLETICLKCLQKQPAQRYASAAELGDDLRRYLDRQPIWARPVGIVERALKWIGRHPAVTALLAVIVVLTLASLVTITRLYRDALYQARLAQRQRDLAQDERDRADQARRQEEEARRRAELSLYAYRFTQALREGEMRNIDRALPLLRACEPAYRGWEHGHLLARYAGVPPWHTLRGHKGRIESIHYSPDGALLATGAGDGTVRLWDARTGKLIRALTGHAGTVWSVRFSPDGAWLACGAGTGGADRAGEVRLWEVGSGKLLRQIPGHTDVVWNVRFSPDGTRLATASDVLRVWDTRSGKLLHTLSDVSRSGSNIAFSPDGELLASARGLSVRLWEVSTGKHRRTISGPTGLITAVVFSPDGHLLATASFNDGVRLWDVQTGKLMRTLDRPDSQPICLAFAPDGDRIAAGLSNDTTRTGTLILWDARTGRELLSLADFGGGEEAIAFSPCGAAIAMACIDGSARIYPLLHSWETALPSADGGWAVLDQRRLLLARRGHLQLWDAAVGYKVSESPPLLDLARIEGPLSLDACRDGRRVACGCHDGSVAVHDLRTWQLLTRLRGHRDAVQGVRFGPDADHLVSFSAEGVLIVWDVKNRREVRRIAGLRGQLLALEVDRTGRHVALLLGSDEEDRTGRRIEVIDVQTGESCLSLEDRDEPAQSLAFHPDGTSLYWGSLKGTIEVRDLVSGAARSWKAHDSAVEALAFCPRGSRLASRSRAEVKLWASDMHLEIVTLPAPELPDGALRFSPEGDCLVLAGPEGVVVWHAAGPVPPRPPDARTRAGWHRRLAADAEADQRWFPAAFHLGQLLIATPDDAGLRGRRIKANALLGLWDEVAHDVVAGTQRQPAVLESGATWWAWPLIDTEQYTPLLGALNRCVLRDSSTWAAQAARGQLLMEMRRWGEAATALAEAARLAARRPDLFALWAHAEVKAGRTDRADEARRALLALVPRRVAGWHRGETDPARATDPLLATWHLGHLLADGPANAANLHARRARAALALGRPAAARDDLARAVRLAPDDLSLRCQYAEACWRIDDRAGHRQECSEILRRFAASASARQAYRVARICVLPGAVIGEPGQVLRLAELAAAESEGGEQLAARLLVAAVLIASGQSATAVPRLLALCGQGVQLGPEGPLTWRAPEALLVEAYAKLGHPDLQRRFQAVAQRWRLALALPPSRVAGLVGLGSGSPLFLAAMPNAPVPGWSWLLPDDPAQVQPREDPSEEP